MDQSICATPGRREGGTDPLAGQPLEREARHQDGMRLLTTFARAYPRQTTMALLALLVGALVEGVGLSALLPLLTVAVGGGSSEIATGGLGKAVTGALGLVGVGATPGALVVLIVVTAAVKSALMLLANRHVGYAGARPATDLRLALIRALLGARWEDYAGHPAR